MHTTLWIVQGLLALVFLASGAFKTFQYQRAIAVPAMGVIKVLPRGLVTFIGVSEMLGGLGLLLPPLTGRLLWLTPLAATGLAIIMVLAARAHAREREWPPIIGNTLFFVLAVFVAYGRWALVPF